MTNSLTKFDAAKHALAIASTVDEVKEVRDKAEAMRAYAKQAGESLEMQNQCAAIKLRAERKAGEMLAGMERARPADNLNVGPKSRELTTGPTLADLGVSRNQSSQWQKIAAMPEDVFEDYISGTIASRRELTSKQMLLIAKKLEAAARASEPVAIIEGVSTSLEEIVESGNKFGCIYADPPWKYDNQGTRAATSNHYGTMSVDELCEMPVVDFAADDAHLHLWTTNAFIFDCQRIMEAWGFTYKSMMVWVKPDMGIGNYWRVQHEFLLLGTRGSADFRDKNLPSWIEHKRLGHSTKPHVFREAVEKVSPGPRIELFARNDHPNWVSWGNEVTTNLFSKETDDAAAING